MGTRRDIRLTTTPTLCIIYIYIYRIENINNKLISTINWLKYRENEKSGQKYVATQDNEF